MEWLFRLALVIHIVGILWLFSAITLELLGALLLRRATTVETVRSAGSILKQLPKFFGPSSALIALSGLYMSWVRLDHNESIGWIVVAIVAFLVMMTSGTAIGKKDAEAMKTELQHSNGTMTDGLRALTHQTRGLRQSLLGICIVLGIVVLMIYKPNVPVSILVIILAYLLGLAATRWTATRLPQ